MHSIKIVLKHLAEHNHKHKIQKDFHYQVNLPVIMKLFFFLDLLGHFNNQYTLFGCNFDYKLLSFPSSIP